VSAEAAIVGIGETSYSRRPPQSLTAYDLLADAASRALRDAGLSYADVDGLGVSSFSLAPDRAIDLAVRLGLRVRWLMDGGTGGSSALDMLQHARHAVEAGDASCVLLVAGDVFRANAFRSLVDDFNVATREHLAPIPHGGPNALFALVTQRHMQRHGLDRTAYGRLVVAQRAWAAQNPNAVYREPLTLDDYRDAPIVAEPLGVLDCVPPVSGADAILVAAARRGVRVRSIAVLHNADRHEGDGVTTGLSELAPRLWDAAGVGPPDADVASIYDDYPAMVLVQLEDLGFGRPAPVLDAIEARRLLLNTSGGQLSAGQAGAAGGMHGLVEVVRQLRGDAGERQIEQARIGVVTGYGMIAYRHGACSSAAVLEAP
jgi:acetyl-CoA acetyltransferase